MVDKRKTVVKQETSNKRASRGKEKVVEKPVSRKVRPLYPMQPLDVKQREDFAQTLDRMGLRGLLDLCWDFSDQAMCDEVYLGKPHPDFKNSIRA
jgi:hypothetical protein